MSQENAPIPFDPESHFLPSINVIPTTPPANQSQEHTHPTFTDVYDGKSDELLDTGLQSRTSTEHNRHVHYPSDTIARDGPSRLSTIHHDPVPNTQQQILTALAVGAPLIASVVSSCTSVICADLTSALGDDPHSRPAKASAVVALLWCALVTSLGSTMMAVAGLAMHAGYHDSHVGVTKRIVRFLRQWRKDRKALKRRQEVETGHYDTDVHLNVRAVSPALSAVTDGHKEQHAMASFRAAVVSSRLLGFSVALLAMAIAIYLFVLYPISVAATTLAVGVGTVAATVAPLLPILLPRHNH
ncbi:hypothetical protein QCA50_019286 [Cerrena zonata]|uniref:Transmembrane protein n=1 Tax=Cerrena zonata TaxID=2478898 RepID=A0AAW0FFQ3_9APHY